MNVVTYKDKLKEYQELYSQIKSILSKIEKNFRCNYLASYQKMYELEAKIFEYQIKANNYIVGSDVVVKQENKKVPVGITGTIFDSKLYFNKGTYSDFKDQSCCYVGFKDNCGNIYWSYSDSLEVVFK